VNGVKKTLAGGRAAPVRQCLRGSVASMGAGRFVVWWMGGGGQVFAIACLARVEIRVPGCQQAGHSARPGCRSRPVGSPTPLGRPTRFSSALARLKLRSLA